MATSLKDIAARLNISVSTVSYALNDGPRQVSPETKQRVLDVARDLKYRPNRMAQAMITGRSHTIGIVLPELVTNALLSPYLHIALNAVANEAGRLGQDILIFTQHKDHGEIDFVNSLHDGRVDGLIFFAPSTVDAIEHVLDSGLPCTVISACPEVDVPCFKADNFQGVELAMRHLYELGHRKIAHLAGRLDMPDAIDRLRGYQQFLRDHRIAYRDEWVVQGRFLIEHGREAMKTLMALPERPTAVFCANDEMAIGAVLACNELSIRVPDEISVVGFDCIPTSMVIAPAITSVRQPVDALSTAAVQALVALIEDREPETNLSFVTELIVRSSTSNPKVESLL